MHISEGVLSAPLLITGGGLAVVGTAIGLKKLDYDRVPQTAIMASAFFLASLVHVPVGPSSVHLVLNGLLGIILGWAAFPAILVALTLQAVLFQFGGLTSLGVNVFNMALPAVVCYYALSGWIKSDNARLSTIGCFLAGAGSILGSALLIALTLFASGDSFTTAAEMIVVAHIPIMIAEGVITATTVQFLKKVKPEVLHAATVH